MIPLEHVIDRLNTAFPEAALTRIENPSPSAQHSLLVESKQALEIARFLRDDPGLLFDYCSNVSGVDWPEREVEEAVTTTEEVDGETKQVKKTVKRWRPGYLEAVYHLYSVSLKHGPLVLRVRTADRRDGVQIPSLTPVWKSAELQEREVYDLYGIRFLGHPDMRRLLLWEGFDGHPMRKDFQLPDEDVLAEPVSALPAPQGGQPV